MPATIEELEIRVKTLEDRSRDCREWIHTHDRLVPELRREQTERCAHHCREIKAMKEWKDGFLKEFSSWRSAVDRKLLLFALIAGGTSGGLTWLSKLMG